MARPKRTASQTGSGAGGASAPEAKKPRKEVDGPPTKNGRPKRVASENAMTNKKQGAPPTAAVGRSRRISNGQSAAKPETEIVKDPKSTKSAKATKASTISEASEAAKMSKSVKKTKSASKASESKSATGMPRGSNFSIEIPAYDVNDTEGSVTADGHDVKEDEVDDEDEDQDGPSYWLMKAEPETRIEKGKDVRFSIDDLAARTEPEAWDGVRNPTARNNMRAMMKGDLAFFYHSNCKIPGIAGVLEVVQEHSVDESAFDPEHPYFDAKSTRDKPKWEVVHVEYCLKFKELIKLKDLQKFAKDGGVLQHMQTLKQSRLSVSKVSRKEWDFIWSLAEVDETLIKPSSALDTQGQLNNQV